MEYNKEATPVWIKAVLIVAFIYSIVWGAMAILLPKTIFAINATLLPGLLPMWQLAGLAEIAMAVGYIVAYSNPYRYWVQVLVGFIFKTGGILVFIISALQNPALWGLKNYVILNAGVWAIPFAAILYQVYLHSFSADNLLIKMFSDPRYSLDMFETNEGIDLKEMSNLSPVMLVFLRHFGCTFCREAMIDLANIRNDIESRGTKIVFVHMLEDEDEAHTQMTKFGWPNAITISDPESILYKKFGLRKGGINQLYGIKIWVRGFFAGWLKGAGIGKAMGDINQMPGVFLIYRGVVRKSFVHRSAADRPKYLELADCEDCNVYSI